MKHTVTLTIELPAFAKEKMNYMIKKYGKTIGEAKTRSTISRFIRKNLDEIISSRPAALEKALDAMEIPYRITSWAGTDTEP